MWFCFLICLVLLYCRLERFFCRKSRVRGMKDPKKNDEIRPDEDADDMSVERIRIENMELRFALFLPRFSIS